MYAENNGGMVKYHLGLTVMKWTFNFLAFEKLFKILNQNDFPPAESSTLK